MVSICATLGGRPRPGSEVPTRDDRGGMGVPLEAVPWNYRPARCLGVATQAFHGSGRERPLVPPGCRWTFGGNGLRPHAGSVDPKRRPRGRRARSPGCVLSCDKLATGCGPSGGYLRSVMWRPTGPRGGAAAADATRVRALSALSHSSLASPVGSSHEWLDHRLWVFRLSGAVGLVAYASLSSPLEPRLGLVVCGCAAYLLASRLVRPTTGAAGGSARWGLRISLDLVGITAMVALTGGGQSVAGYLYLLPLVVGALVLEWRQALAAAVAAVAADLAVSAATASPLPQSPRDTGALVFSLLAVTTLASLVRRAEDRLRSQLSDFADEVNDTARSVDRQLDLPASLTVVGRKVAEVAGATGAVISTYSHERAQPEVRWARGPLPGAAPGPSTTSESRGPSEPRGSLRGRGWRRRTRRPETPELRSLPLRIAGNTVGKIDLTFPGPVPGLDRRLSLVEPLLYHGALAVLRERQGQGHAGEGPGPRPPPTGGAGPDPRWRDL